MKDIKLKFDKEAMRRTCYFAVENEIRKGNQPINKDSSPLTKEQYYQESLDLFKNPSFIADMAMLLNKTKGKK